MKRYLKVGVEIPILYNITTNEFLDLDIFKYNEMNCFENMKSKSNLINYNNLLNVI
jgi:hypothetical protein